MSEGWPRCSGRRMEECVPTPRKVAQVAELTDVVSRAEIAISTSYAGMTMAKQTELRTTLRKAGAEMHVVKNTLLRIAADRAAYWLSMRHWAQVASHSHAGHQSVAQLGALKATRSSCVMSKGYATCSATKPPQGGA